MSDTEPTTIDPHRLRGELARYLETSLRYVRRQGLTDEEVRAIVERMLLTKGQPTR